MNKTYEGKKNTMIKTYEVMEFGYKVHAEIYPLVDVREWDRIVKQVSKAPKIERLISLFDTSEQFHDFYAFREAIRNCGDLNALNAYDDYIRHLEEVYYYKHDQLHNLAQNELESLSYLGKLLDLE
jgi:hypothetical protein